MYAVPRRCTWAGLASPAAGASFLLEWRTLATEPSAAATLADPEGAAYRRRYRWSGGRIVDHWDEVPGDDDEGSLHVSPDVLSALVSRLSEARTRRMRNALTTLQTVQDAIIRADFQGTLIVDCGPGTGKTVVALHRAAHLLLSPLLRSTGSTTWPRWSTTIHGSPVSAEPVTSSTGSDCTHKPTPTRARA